LIVHVAIGPSERAGSDVAAVGAGVDRVGGRAAHSASGAVPGIDVQVGFAPVCRIPVAVAESRIAGSRLALSGAAGRLRVLRRAGFTALAAIEGIAGGVDARHRATLHGPAAAAIVRHAADCAAGDRIALHLAIVAGRALGVLGAADAMVGAVAIRGQSGARGIAGGRHVVTDSGVAVADADSRRAVAVETGRAGGRALERYRAAASGGGAGEGYYKDAHTPLKHGARPPHKRS